MSLVLAASGALAAAQTLTPLPGQGSPVGPEVRGQIVRVDPVTGMVVIRTGTGKLAREREYRVMKNTRYFGRDNIPLTNGLRYNGWRPGTNVWYQTVPGASNMNLNYLRMTPTPVPAPGGVRPGGTVPSPAPRPGGAR
jgi:hypothetical protein